MMMLRVEWDEAATCKVNAADRDTANREWGAVKGFVREDAALLLGGDNDGAFLVEGSRPELIAFAQKVLEAACSLPEEPPAPSWPVNPF